MAILDSLIKFLFCFKFMKSDKREIIKYQYENIFFFYGENSLIAKVGF